MFSRSSDRRFVAALMASGALHVVALASAEFLRRAQRALPAAEEAAPAPRLEAHLLPAHAQAPDEHLLKNTLAESQPAEPIKSLPPPEPPPPARNGAPRTAPKRAPIVVHEAQLKLAAHMFYPREAIELGLEGEVRVLLKLAPDGSILEASIAAGSGHPLLDQAAVNAALAMRRVPVAGADELILPVVFKLQ